MIDKTTKAQECLAALNAALVEEGDPARARYVAIEPDPDFVGEELALVTWELPRDGADSWPLTQLDVYCEKASKQLADLVPTVECLFRTGVELAEYEVAGEPVPDPAVRR